MVAAKSRISLHQLNTMIDNDETGELRAAYHDGMQVGKATLKGRIYKFAMGLIDSPPSNQLNAAKYLIEQIDIELEKDGVGAGEKKIDIEIYIPEERKIEELEVGCDDI
jgi:hypothetical protein